MTAGMDKAAVGHKVQPHELASACAAQNAWKFIHEALPLDSRDWNAAVQVERSIEGWLEVAREYGETRHSFGESLARAIANRNASHLWGAA